LDAGLSVDFYALQEEGVMKSPVTCALAAGALLFSGRLMAGPTAPETVTAPLDGPLVQSSLGVCTAGENHPDTIKLVIFVYQDGSMRLVSTIPPMGEETTLCLRQVVSRVKTGEPDLPYNLVHVFHPSGSAEPPSPSSDTPTKAISVEKQPGNQKSVEVERPILALDDYASGRRTKVAGIVLTSVGIPVMISPLVFTIIDQSLCTAFKLDFETEDTACDFRFDPLLLSVAIIGVVTFGTGIALIAAGKKKQAKATRQLLGKEDGQLSVAPFAGRESGGLAFTMTF
jgi:hypothetical protein